MSTSTGYPETRRRTDETRIVERHLTTHEETARRVLDLIRSAPTHERAVEHLRAWVEDGLYLHSRTTALSTLVAELVDNAIKRVDWASIVDAQQDPAPTQHTHLDIYRFVCGCPACEAETAAAERWDHSRERDL